MKILKNAPQQSLEAMPPPAHFNYCWQYTHISTKGLSVCHRALHGESTKPDLCKDFRYFHVNHPFSRQQHFTLKLIMVKIKIHVVQLNLMLFWLWAPIDRPGGLCHESWPEQHQPSKVQLHTLLTPVKQYHRSLIVVDKLYNARNYRLACKC